MQTLDRALATAVGTGRQIQIPFTRWQKLVDFRTGDIAVLAGAPGGGKSLTALNWAHRTTDSVLYLGQDSPRSVRRRLVALTVNQPVHDIREEDNDHWSQQILDYGGIGDVILNAGAVSVQDIDDMIVAMTEWLMEPPKVVFVDNLIDMRSDEAMHMDNNFYADILTNLKQLAIEKDVGVVLLHHVSRGDAAEGTEPLTMTSLLFGGEREARHVWGVYRGGDDRRVFIQVLKQQDGQADASGNLKVDLSWMPKEGRLYNA